MIFDIVIVLKTKEEVEMSAMRIVEFEVKFLAGQCLYIAFGKFPFIHVL
jgi:hypothetical protein